METGRLGHRLGHPSGLELGETESNRLVRFAEFWSAPLDFRRFRVGAPRADAWSDFKTAAFDHSATPPSTCTSRHSDEGCDQARDHETKTGLGLAELTKALLASVAAGDSSSVPLARELAASSLLGDPLVQRALA